MEKFSTWRDSQTGIAPFVLPVPPASSESASPLFTFGWVPVSYVFSAARTLLVVLVLLLQWILVEGVCCVLAPLPQLQTTFAQAVTSAIARLALLLFGYGWIKAEAGSVRKSRSAAVIRGPNNLLVGNYSSYVEILYLAYKYNPQFVQPLQNNGSIIGFRSITLLQMIAWTGSPPPHSAKASSLEQIMSTCNRPVAIFPETTTSNNRAILKFAPLPTQPIQEKWKVYLFSFKHEAPTAFSPSAACPIPSALPLQFPLQHMLEMNRAIGASRMLQIRIATPPDTPAYGSVGFWENCSKGIEVLGRWKRTGLSWEDKKGFLGYLAKDKDKKGLVSPRKERSSPSRRMK